MKFLAALVLVVPTAGRWATGRSAAAAPHTPVKKAIELLQSLQEKLESDLKIEEDLFETFRCWAKKIVDTKTASNSEATARVQSLETYIADIQAGKIEFTTERVDLEKQVAELQQDLQLAQATRNQEAKDYSSARHEMMQALAAIGSAITVLEGGMPTSLAQAKNVRWALSKALLFGRKTLGADDVHLLEDAVQKHRDVPEWDWKKLNRKATFKKSYEGQSGGIVQTLKSLQDVFTNNLASAEDSESKAIAAYNALKTAKGAMLATAQSSLTAMVAEGSARGLSMQQAQDEADALQAQVSADTQFITDADNAFTAKKAEWDARKVLRVKEISEISKAVALLSDHDNRHIFEESFKSQGYTLVQLSEKPGATDRAARAAHVLSATASVDAKLALLAIALKSGNHLSVVINKIDALIAVLQTEEQNDLTKKEACEAGVASTAQSARMASLDVDTLTEDIAHAKSRVEELTVQIEDQNKIIAQVNMSIIDLEHQRSDENAQFLKDQAADEAAVGLISEALVIVQTVMQEMSGTSAAMLSKNVTVKTASKVATASPVATTKSSKRPATGLATVARRLKSRSNTSAVAASHRQAPGEAPPPPPSTWGTPYGGAQAESNGIVAMLTLIKEDIEKDIQLGQTEENDAITAFNQQKGDLEAAITAAGDAISDLDIEKAGEETTIQDKGGERTDRHGAMRAAIDETMAYRKTCDYLLINFEHRVQHRQLETDGLLKAKTILSEAR